MREVEFLLLLSPSVRSARGTKSRAAGREEESEACWRRGTRPPRQHLAPDGSLDRQSFSPMGRIESSTSEQSHVCLWGTWKTASSSRALNCHVENRFRRSVSRLLDAVMESLQAPVRSVELLPRNAVRLTRQGGGPALLLRPSPAGAASHSGEAGSWRAGVTPTQALRLKSEPCSTGDRRNARAEPAAAQGAPRRAGSLQPVAAAHCEEMADRLAPETRHQFKSGGQTVYEWDQTVDDVNVYVTLPPGVPGNMFTCILAPQHITIGIKGNPPYMNHDLGGRIKVEDSFWTIEDGVLHVTLQKAERAQPWPGALAAHPLDAFSTDQESRRLMLERFQAENPGFDFSGAEFTGSCPDPAKFMGGMAR